jgi:hypothetical protein
LAYKFEITSEEEGEKKRKIVQLKVLCLQENHKYKMIIDHKVLFFLHFFTKQNHGWRGEWQRATINLLKEIFGKMATCQQQ